MLRRPGSVPLLQAVVYRSRYPLPDYSIKVSGEISKLKDDKFIQNTLISCQGRQITLPEKFHPDPKFLKWHNINIFKP